MSIEAVFARQHGLITFDQARAYGLTRNQIAYRVRKQEWVRVHRSVFRHSATPNSWLQRVHGAVLAADGIASHRTGLALWNVGPFNRPRIAVTHAYGVSPRRVAGATVHRSTQWSARQETRRRGIPCAGIERTIMDAAATMSVDLVERVAEDAVRQRLTTFGSLATYLIWHGRKGRTGCGNLRKMLQRRAPDAQLPLSDFSRRVVQLLRDAGLPDPEVEYRVFDAKGVFILQADLAWPRRRKIVELDGLAWHFGRDEVERDRRKRARARAEGWRIHEVLWSMYVEDPPGLARQIADFLRS